MSGSSLAFVGDAVWTLYIRERIASECDKKSGGLHAIQSRYVSAVAQSRMAVELCNKYLNPQEMDIFNRCKNAHVDNKTRAATYREYKNATGLEGVMGYLYLSSNKDRLKVLCDLCYCMI
jgi:ribonuclease-3 family protein